MSTPREFHRLEALFHELADLAPEARRDRLETLRAEEPDLHPKLVRLLERDGAELAVLPAAAPPVAAPGPGDRLGDYRLVRELAEGGMGVVWEARQEAPLERQVAIKLVRGELGGPRVLERFEAERGTLARMSHPGIAQVFDAGTAPDGRPYLVMELVEGEPITRFCDRHRSTTVERIRLFLEVCDALRHAHQKGILHRDLKPGNVLVAPGAGGRPHVKVIDFGIAKLVAGSDPGPGLTRRGEIVGTPEYMSPEQARGEDLDTRSDVYSLGVVLYELLTGDLPLDRESLASASPVELARRVESLPMMPPEARLLPDRPGVAEIAALRGTEAGKLRRELGGDLGQILRMALRKEPARRYGSVEQLAADLERCLEGRPVIARPDSFGYRARKLVERHPAAVLSASLLVATLAAATFFSTRMYLAAESARRDSESQRLAAERIAGFLAEMLGSVDPQLARGRDVTLLREILDRAAVQVDLQFSSLPAVAADLNLTIGRTYASLGLADRAEDRLRASLALWRGLEPSGVEGRIAAELALGVLLRDRDRYEEGERLLRSAVEARRSRRPVDGVALAEAVAALAEFLEDTGDFDEAATLFAEALDLLRSSPDADVEALAAVLRGYGEHLMNHHRMAEAEPLLREALAVRRADGQRGASLVLPLLTYGRWLRWSERVEEAVAPIGEAVEISRRDLPDDHPSRLEAISELGNLEQHRGRYEIAETLYREALAAQRRVHGELHSEVATTTNNLASLLREAGRLDEAERLFAAAVAGYVASFGPDHYWVSIARLNRGRVLLDLRRPDAAELELEEALRIRRVSDAEGWQLAEIEVPLAACRVARGETGSVESILRNGIATLRDHYGESTPRVAVGVAALERLERVRESPDRRTVPRESAGGATPPPED